MKFTDGNWMLRPGVQAGYPAEARDVELSEGTLTVYAPTRQIVHRGDTLTGPCGDFAPPSVAILRGGRRVGLKAPEMASRAAAWQLAGRAPDDAARRCSPMPDRERIERGKDQRYVRRDDQGRFTPEQVDVGGSLTRDRRQPARTEVPKGQGDRGDQRRPG